MKGRTTLIALVDSLPADGTWTQDMRDRCMRGHPLSGDNLRVNADGDRLCRTCARESRRRYDNTTRRARRAALKGPRPTTGPWIVWAYALTPGWERTDSYRTRDEAREIRDYLVEEEGWPVELVRIRRESDGPPKSRSPRDVLLALLRALEVARG